ncbi:hypothetical protein ES708_09074 [subsurface metagenome]
MRMILSNGQTVKVNMKELSDFITEIPSPIPNASWRHSELLTEQEVMSFLAGHSNKEELQKIARYLLIFTENIAFAAYLFDKAEDKPDQTKEFNMPAIKKLRELYQRVKDDRHTMMGLYRLVSEMESICLEIGADPL